MEQLHPVLIIVAINMDDQRRLLVPDTNIFLHFRPLNQIDWCKLAGTAEVQIAVIPVVIRELDKHKTGHASDRIRRRAAAALLMLDRTSSTPDVPIRAGCYVQVVTTDPQIDFRAAQLSEHVQDDYLIASSLELSHSSRAPVIVVTADLGLKLKAKAHGLGVIPLPDEYRLPNEPDPNEVELRRLRAELLRLQTRLPNLSLAFPDGSPRYAVTVARSDPTPADIKELMVGVKKKHAPYELASDERSKTLARLAFMEEVSLKDIENYNGNLPSFYDAFERYLQELACFEAEQGRVIRLDIELQNDGTAPAEDIDIEMHFPNGFVLTDKKSRLPRPPSPPTPPEYPKTQMERLRERMDIGALRAFPTLNPRALAALASDNVSSCDIAEVNSYRAKVHVKHLKHSRRVKVNTFYVVFESCDHAKSFGIDYVVHSADLPTPQSGRLDVIVSKGLT